MKKDAESSSDNRSVEELECELSDTKQKLDHIIGSMPGGIALYRYFDDRFIAEYYTDGVPTLTGHTRAEYDKIIENNSLDIVYPIDRKRVGETVLNAMREKRDTEIAYRILHKNGSTVWVQMHLRFIGTGTEDVKLYAVFMGMSPETKLFRTIANDSADGIYVMDQSNFDLFYVNESSEMFVDAAEKAVGRKCYEALHGRSEQCEFCPLREGNPDAASYTVVIPETGRIYDFRFREIDWYGIPAYAKYVSDVTEVTGVRRQKEKLEHYFGMMINNLSGGVTVCVYDEPREILLPEFISEGFAVMCGMTIAEAWELYGSDAYQGVHPDDIGRVINLISEKIKAKSNANFEIVYRLKKKDGSYFWVKNTNTLLYSEGRCRTYSVFADITDEVEEHKRNRNFYKEMIFRHHQSGDPNMLIAGHCNVTKKRIVRITDRDGRDLVQFKGKNRDLFFETLASYIENEEERKAFLEAFRTEDLLESFSNGTAKREIDCIIKFPKDARRRYMRVTVNLIESPDTGDVMGILSAVDHTDRRVSDLILHSIIINDYDFISVLDLATGTYTSLSYNETVKALPAREGVFAEQVARFLDSFVAPKDRAECEEKLNIDYIRRTLQNKNSFSFHYSVDDDEGGTYDKNMVVFYIDKRLDKVCLARTDISESVIEQRRLLNALAYAFELVSFVDVSTSRLTVHTRNTLLNKLPPRCYPDLDREADIFSSDYGTEESRDELRKQMSLQTILNRLASAPRGYEFSFSCRANRADEADEADESAVRYKQVSVMWGDEFRRTVCMVRADVTDTIKKEHETREHLKSALTLANEANRAKTDFLSSMSHDIRTPMNAIVGMTELALADRDNPAQIDESLAVIKSSSDHLLRLINEILDMSRIESGKLSLASEPFSHHVEFGKFIARSTSLAEKKHIRLTSSIDIRHDACIGDTVRLHQIFDNLVGNAVKFTPEGGSVDISMEELPEKSDLIGCYRYTVSDTGIGMDAESVKNIFDPFYRSDNGIVRKTEGTGLGLSIVKSILDYKSGTIKVESEPGKGSRFIVEIPLRFATSPVPVAKIAGDKGDTMQNLSGTRVLLIEDNPVNCLVAVKMLERAGVNVASAENGAEGARKFAASAPGEYDAIFMDIQMPVMDGYEATRTIRSAAHPQAKSIPIIAMTANAFNSDVKRCLDAGMNAHIAKPIDPEKLYRILKSFVGGG